MFVKEAHRGLLSDGEEYDIQYKIKAESDGNDQGTSIQKAILKKDIDGENHTHRRALSKISQSINC